MRDRSMLVICVRHAPPVVSQGVTVLQELLLNPVLCGMPPVIAMTGNTSQQDQAKYIASGFTDTLGKPFSADDLSKLLARFKSR